MFNYKKVSTDDTNGYFFDSTTYLPYPNYLTSSTNFTYPDTDIKRVDDAFVIQIDVPGYDKNNIDISYENDVLSVSGTVNEENETKENEKYFVKERRMKSFSKKWILKNTTSKGITAKCENGVLTIKVPLRESEDKTENKIQID
jgi:heat shock protein hsp20